MSGKAVRETLGFVAVVAGLVFVGLEIQQNTAVARGATMQAISDASASFMADMALDADFADIVGRVFQGSTRSEFTTTENQQMIANLIAFVRMLENTCLQNREGLVPDAVFESYGWNDAVTRTAYFAEWWERNWDGVVSPEFKRCFESRVQIGPTFVAAFEAEYDLAP